MTAWPFIHRGTLREMGPTRALVEKFSRKKVILKFLSPMSALAHPDLVTGSDTEWTFLVGMDKPLGALLREVNVSSDQLRDVQVAEGTLEDVFLRFTQEHAIEHVQAVQQVIK
ncbi:MAG: hypothetical protein HC883_04945 [Bdellovibrionaceae bacterium]|nr:hypothetical protein [Pseudobdellovibrionaceae bacterium]